MSDYPETFLRGLKGKVLTEHGYVLAEAFNFNPNKERTENDMQEMSVNWEDCDEAVDLLLQQKKDDCDELQFNVGFARLETKEMKRSMARFIRDGLFSFERRPIEGNPYHGNLLRVNNIEKGEERLIKNTLANMASTSVYIRDDGTIPYKQNIDSSVMNNDSIHIPKVSVIVPVYGVETFIERCARSLFEQTLDDIEYLFIDDCTPDKSIEVLMTVLEEYPQRKRQVVIHRMDMNSGQAVVRHWGMQNATGEYIIQCDSDDWIDTDMYRSMYEKAVETDADFVVCNYCESNGNEVKDVIQGSHTEDAKVFFENIIYQTDQWSLCNKLFRRSLLKDDLIYPKYAMGEDYVLCLQLVWNSSRMVFIDKTYYYYYTNEQSLTKSASIETIEKRFHQSIGNAEDILRFLNEKGIYDRYKEAIDCVLLNKKNILLPLIGIKKYYKLWYNTFPGLNFSIFRNRRLSFKSKVKHLIVLSPFRKFYYRYEG